MEENFKKMSSGKIPNKIIKYQTKQRR